MDQDFCKRFEEVAEGGVNDCDYKLYVDAMGWIGWIVEMGYLSVLTDGILSDL